jgi:hypothetical protein
MRLWTRLLLVIAMSVSLVGCGSSSKPSAEDRTRTPPTSSSPVAVDLPAFIAHVQAGSQVAFTASYVLPGSNTEVTVQQQLPSYYSSTAFENGSTEIKVTDGTHQYVCESDTKTCSAPSFDVPISDFVGYYGAGYWVAKMQQWPTSIAGQYDAVKITSSTMTIAGQETDCVTYENPDETDRICLFDDGVIADVEAKETSFYVAEISPGVTPGIFAVPAGYTVADR